MKRLFVILLFALITLALSAIPAKRGLWQMLTLADGTEVKAQLTGDEHIHFWQAEDGRKYVITEDGTARPADMEKMRARARHRRNGTSMARRLRSPHKVSMGEKTHYVGEKKGMVILMQFTDTKFKTADVKTQYNDILNKEDYDTSPFKGSVADYFKAQSGGQFKLSFDVMGPYTAKNSSSYYGANDKEGNDKHPDELVAEALKAADEEVDFHDYDWDGDGEVDQVFVLYAGKGEADGGGDNTIWPHMWLLSETGMEQTLDSVRINTYACSNELTPGGGLSGIGCFCHEFSHCLGYPDFYDTSYSGWFGMSEFDLMDQGSYNGNAFLPAGYTAYEKWMAGWIEPTVLADEEVTVEKLAPTYENGGAYIMYNDAHTDEYYVIENRQKTGWDAGLPAKGLMITHVDFDKIIWEENTPNTKVTQSDILASNGDYTKVNDHQRCTIFHADNDDDSKYWSRFGYYTTKTLTNDLYPYNGNDSLTATSKPAAMLYNDNSQGKKMMRGGIRKITQNSDGTISFVYSIIEIPEDTIEIPDPVKPVEARGDTLLYESFNLCASIGGKDGKWGTDIAQSASKFIADNKGWEYEAAYAGYQCARFGNATKSGQTTTPIFTISGEATLTFQTAGWYNDDMTLNVSVTGANTLTSPTVGATPTVSPSTFTMKSYEWTEHTAKVTGEGNIRITFTPKKRFILDEVLVIAKRDTTGIDDLRIDPNSTPLPGQRTLAGQGFHNPTTIYTLDGRRVGNSLDNLPHGVFIINRKKIVK